MAFTELWATQSSARMTNQDGVPVAEITGSISGYLVDSVADLADIPADRLPGTVAFNAKHYIDPSHADAFNAIKKNDGTWEH